LRRVLYSLLVPYLLLGCVALGEETSPAGMPVESYVLVEPDEINSRIRAAVEAGQEWQLDPVAIAIKFLGTTNYRYLNIERKIDKNSASKAVVTVIRGALKDDSIWGNWEQLHMSRNEAGVWGIDEVRRAWRCYRRHQTKVFGERICP